MEQQTLERSGNFVSPDERWHLMRLCMSITGNKDAAEDLVQETLLEAWLHEEALRDTTKRSRWLTGVARNVCEESPLAELADQLGTKTSAVAMRLQRSKLALRCVQSKELRQEIAPYTVASAIDGWEETPIWCHLCGRYRLQGKRDAKAGKLLFKCPNCSPSPNELLSYNELSVLKGIKGYKRTSVIGDIASGCTVMLIPLLYSTVGLAFWQLLALVFIGGLLKSPGVTARSSMVPDLARAAEMRLERANALWDGVNRVAGLIGAPIAGFLIVLIGTSNLLWLDAASFGISALLIGWAVPATPPVLHKEDDSARRSLARLLDGTRFIRHQPVILTIAVTAMVTNMLDGSFFSVLEPAYIKQVFHSALPLGLIVAALGGAAFVGTIIFGMIGHRLPRRWTFGLGYTIGGSFRFWVLLVPVLPLIIAWNVIAGLCIAPINPLADTVEQERIPQTMRARVFGTMSASVLAGIPLGTFAGGYVAAWLGLRTTIILMGGIYLLTTAALLINPALKEM